MNEDQPLVRFIEAPASVRVDQNGCVVLSKEDKDQLNRIEAMLKKFADEGVPLRAARWVGGPR